MTRTRTQLALVQTAVVLVGMAVAGPSCRAMRGGPPTNVVLVSLDTTRADWLSPYGFMDAPMPALDWLAREGVLFDQAVSVGALTLPAHTSLLTGLLPPTHLVRDNSSPGLAGDRPTLASVLQARGYRTGAFVGSTILAADRGLSRGFARYGDVPKTETRGPLSQQRRADAVVREAIAWLEEPGAGAAPFFLWTHLYDAHRPYDPPEPFRSRLLDPYVGEIAFADAHIGRLLDTLERRGLLDRTLVVVVGDHGESLGEHGERDHGIFVYESVLRVPLIMRGPGIAPGRTASLVRIVDVMPTVLELLGAPPVLADGTSVVPLLRGERAEVVPEAYAESVYPERFGWSPLFVLRDTRYKLIDAPRPELYDLARDPFEEKNLFAERRSVADAMTARLGVIRSSLAARAAPASAPAPAPHDVSERLASLGYVGGSRPPPATASGKRPPDPKDCIGTLRHLSPSSENARPAAPVQCK